MKYKLSLSILFIVLFQLTYAGVTLPAVLGDNMVLKQNSSVTLWGKASANSAVKVTTSWNQKNYSVSTNSDGNFILNISTAKAGGPFTISFLNNGEVEILKNILLGEVWFCSGQSNMEMPLKGWRNMPVLNSKELIAHADNENIRIFNPVKSVSFTEKESASGKWELSTPGVASNTSAVAWEFAQILQKKLGVPVGIIVSAWGGTPIRSWMSRESLKSFPSISLEKPDTIISKTPAALFNGMIVPFLHFSISGILWYQGENDHKDVDAYQKMMPAMVKDWRARFGNEKLPFYYVQIAPWKYERSKIPYAAIFREMQYQLSKTIPNSGIAVTTDVGSNKTIHPPDKTAVANRLVNIALAKHYGKKIPYLGPELKSFKVKGNSMYLKFGHANGLNLKEGGTRNFEIAGKDSVFHKAEAIVKNGKLKVWSDEVQTPEAVRYTYENYAQGNLFNNSGLPASTFRTDKWTIANK